MKKDLHPDNYRPVVFQDKSGEFRFLTRSCATTKDTIEWEDGNEYPLVNVEISSASHPFYTGKQKFVDAAGRLEKFGKKYNWEDSSKDQIEEAAKKRKKKAGKEKVGSLDIPTFKRKSGEEEEGGGGPRDKGDKPGGKPAAKAKEAPAAEKAEKPAAEQAAPEKPAAKEPAAEKPAAEEPAAEKPAAEEPAAEKPAAEEPAAEKPAAEEPAAEESAAEKPAAEDS